ncbi:MAG: hypothetical protein ACRDJX_08605 [Solirubrobacteraceae bacterium]
MTNRKAKRPRRYLARHWLLLVRPLIRYSAPRDAYVLRLVGRSWGPVLRLERRRQERFEGVERRRSHVAA